ncbi:unnamed protein product [Rotaria sordida]|uniref:F-box domain-containing protein n=1 Tax=Rotaria sordida TaxID=392033 RepID=A0A816ASK8_9BILA|nr:unnamed protein product [Rotaria sordida]CAF1600278.1 unnamed protein product [Rotaria sordida]
MKTKLTNRRRKKIKKFSTTLSNKSISYRQNNLFYSLPVIILDHIASYLKGSDALNFAECITNDALTAERKFWKTLGPKWINFSYFLLAGGAVLNSLLIHAFDSSGQDLDFFWIGGSWLDFRSQIDRFRRRSKSHIIQETNLHGKTVGFHQAIATRTFINYKLTQNVQDVHLYIDRCFKYHSRGFTWLCPIKFHDLLVQKPLICASKTIDYGFNDFYFNVDSFRVQECFLDLHPFDDDE